MNIEELKKLVKNSTAVLVLDNGEPSFVILKYENYKDLIFQEPDKKNAIKNGLQITDENKFLSKSAPASAKTETDIETELLEKINKELLCHEFYYK